MRSANQPSSPGRLRQRATETDWAPLLQLLGFVPHEGLRCALLDPRGRVFQRLEWYGDSILDLLGALHVISPGCCDRLADISSDHALAGRCAAAGIREHLDWAPSDGRLADWAEAAVAAAYETGGWRSAAYAAGRLVHEPLGLLPEPRPATPVTERHGGCTLRRDAAALGAQVVEAAASLRLAAAEVGADEGQLSQMRRAMISQEHITAAAGSFVEALRPGCRRSGREHVADHVQGHYGDLCLAQGVDVAVAAVRL